MLQNLYLVILSNFGLDTGEKEPPKNWKRFSKFDSLLNIREQLKAYIFVANLVCATKLHFCSEASIFVAKMDFRLDASPRRPGEMAVGTLGSSFYGGGLGATLSWI